MRNRTGTLVLTLLATLLFGFAAAAGVAFDDDAFDAFDEDEGYVDLMLENDTLVITFDEEEGSLPATMSGDALPLDGDLEEDRLRGQDALALYGGLPVATSPGVVTIDVDGEASEIRMAVLDRLAALGIQATETFEPGGPVFSYALSRGDAAWTLSIADNAQGATIDLRVD
jgi:hypothetical protein